MKFLSNAHTHTTYCDGLSDIPSMIQAAKTLGFVSLGFSGHAWQGFDLKYCMSPENQNAYEQDLRMLQQQHNDSGALPKIYVGVEQDTLVPGTEKKNNRQRFDYIIGSAHYLDDTADGQRKAVDGPKDELLHLIDDSFGGDVIEMAKAYFRLIGSGVQKDHPDIIGHFDLVRKHAKAIRLETDHPEYRRAALDALEQAFEGCQMLEVNTGIIARGYDTLPHPADFILDAWHEMGGKITLTSDCHDANKLDCCFEATIQTLKKKGFKHLFRLGTGQSLWDDISL